MEEEKNHNTNGFRKDDVGDASNSSGNLSKCISGWMSKVLVP